MEFVSAFSKKPVVINLAPWKDAKILKMAVERAASGMAIDLEDVATLTPLILKLDGSPEVDAALGPCLIRCLYDGEKITDTTFDKKEARADYYEVVIACIKENFGPLVESLSSKFAELAAKKKSTGDTPA